MGFFDRLFGKKRTEAVAGDGVAVGSRPLAGHETGQTAEEQAATRGRMEAEMDTQRNRREPPAGA